MPLPKRYAQEVLDVIKIWEPEGYFNAQAKIWLAQCEVRNELYGKPTNEELAQIREALKLNSEDMKHLIAAKGHETNRFLRLIQERLPDQVGNYVHKGNTGSDVLDTSLSLQIIESLNIVKQDFNDLSQSLKKLAIEHKNTLQIGRTHGQHAIPQTFGRQVLGWYAEVRRGIDRADKAIDAISYGKCSGEIGTNVFIEPKLEEKTLAKLKLKPDEAPTQVISRDRHAEVTGLMAVNSKTLSRIATNIRLLTMTDIGELSEPFEKEAQEGSSAMPHKKNPELDERVSGLSGWIVQAASAELDAMVLWLERDISHSSTERFVFADIFGGLSYSARLLKKVIDGLIVHPDRMLENLNRTFGSIYSPRLFNSLMDKGMSRTQAYELVRNLAQRAMTGKIQLKQLAAEDPQITKALTKAELESVFDRKFYLKNIDIAYKRLGIRSRA